MSHSTHYTDKHDALGNIDDEKIRHLYRQIQSGLGIDFIPNFFRYQATTPSIAETCWQTVAWTLIAGTVPRMIKEMVMVAVSHANQSRYCEVAHLAFCKKLGVEKAQREALLSDLSEIKPDRTRFIIQLSVRLSQQPNNITLSDRTNLARYGIPDHELLEVMSVAAFANYATVVAKALALPIDEEFLTILDRDHTRRSTAARRFQVECRRQAL